MNLRHYIVNIVVPPSWPQKNSVLKLQSPNKYMKYLGPGPGIPGHIREYPGFLLPFQLMFVFPTYIHEETFCIETLYDQHVAQCFTFSRNIKRLKILAIIIHLFV